MLYDGECAFCVGLAERFGGMLERKGFAMVPLQTPWVRERLGLGPGELPEEMKLLTRDGRVLGGVDAYLFMATSYWWARPLVPVLRLPGIYHLLSRLYAHIAARRYCYGGACSAAREERGRFAALAAWMPLVVFVAAAMGVSAWVPAWAFMWMMAFALFAGFKIVTWADVSRAGARPGLMRMLGYLFGAPGMDARPFVAGDRSAATSQKTEYRDAVLRAMAGAVLLWGGVRLCFGMAPVVAGWLGFTAIVLMLHFGALHLISLLWQRGGVATRPIMNAPWRSTSPAVFWGQRWNLAFRDLAHRYVFEPLRRLLGAPMAMFAAFVASGLVHELVISVPAGGGYGGPTAYFAIQGVAVVGSHARAVRRWGLTRGWKGWLFTLAVVVGPLPLVFHSAFMHRVVIPFLDVVGAL